MIPDMNRTLPVKIRPRHLETPESYGRRLALANGLPAESAKKAARQLAVRSMNVTLRTALAEWCEIKGDLREGHFQAQARRADEGLPRRTMCRLCAFGENVEQFGHAESYCCLRHSLWTGPQAGSQTLPSIDDRVRATEIRYRHLRRAGRAPIILVQELAVIVNRHRGENGIDARIHPLNYTAVVDLAQLLTDRAFQRRLFQPTQTFAQARRLLEISVAALLPGTGLVLIDALWRLLRPAFLAVRDKVDGQSHPAPAISVLLGLNAANFVGAKGIPRPMEPFSRYVDLLGSSLVDNWSDTCELTLVAGQRAKPRAASKQGAWEALFICRRGHWSRRNTNSAYRSLKAGLDGCPYCAGLRALAGYNSMAETHPAMASEWHPTRNGQTTPSNVTGAGNSMSFWWVCGSGHEWQATPNNRAKRQGCPYCSGRCLPGFNSLDVTHPSLAAEWNYRLNGDLEPSMITSGSGRVVEWICPRAHAYAATPANRTNKGSGCPVCSNVRVLLGVNDLATTHPHIGRQWHPRLNDRVTAQMVVAGSAKKYYWCCPAGHDYLAAVNSRTYGKGCPGCTGRQVIAGYNDLRTTHPHVAAEWDYAENGSRTPESVIAGSARKARWICPLGHSYAKAVRKKVAGSGCQYCSHRKVLRGFNDLATRHPEIARDWHPEKNESLAASDVISGNAKRWWNCFCGHELFGSVPNRIKTNGCPLCPPGKRVLTS